jgi:hypothetical protein
MVQRQVYSHTRQDLISSTTDYRHSYPDERWEQIEDLICDKFWVSNYGRVMRGRRLMPLHVGRSGLEVRVKGKYYYQKCVHLLVADLFQLTGPKDKVSFRDGNRFNPRLSNIMIKGTRSRHKLTSRQREFCKRLFKKYPQTFIISELAGRFMVSYLTIWKVYKEFIDDCITNGITAYVHFATDPGLLRRFQNVQLDSNGNYVRLDGRPLAWDPSPDSEDRERSLLFKLSKRSR